MSHDIVIGNPTGCSEFRTEAKRPPLQILPTQGANR